MAYLLFTRSFNHCIKSSSWRDVTTFSHGYRCHSQLTLNLLRTQRSKFPLTHFQIASIRRVTRFVVDKLFLKVRFKFLAITVKIVYSDHPYTESAAIMRLAFAEVVIYAVLLFGTCTSGCYT